MRKMFFFVLAAAALLLMVPAQNAQAQSETPRVAFGAHYRHRVAILKPKRGPGGCALASGGADVAIPGQALGLRIGLTFR
jgi:hypothetical protein